MRCPVSAVLITLSAAFRSLPETNEEDQMADMQISVDDAVVIALLEANHGLKTGDALREATEVEFDPWASSPAAGQVVTVTLKYSLSPGEVDRLLGK